jgi:cytoskeletal protein CcmA (bactofilin family)
MAVKTEMATELNLIAAGTVFEGKLRTPGSIRIDGRVVGEIVATNNISVGGAGDIEGNLSAKNITIGGKVQGSVVAQEKLVFESKAVIHGDIHASKLVIDEGAVFDGSCVMTSQSKPMSNLVELKVDQRRAEER